MNGYVLVTAAHNEEVFIERACASVAAQTHRPRKWVVVDDASTDRTAAAVERCRRRHPDLVELVRVQRAPGRDFRHKARAFACGLARVQHLAFEFVGNLDADVSIGRDYYARVLEQFARDPSLGIAGGMVRSCIDGRYVSQEVSLDSVAGAVQLFRRECFEAVGGYLPLRHGGIDAAAEIIARSRGWTVRTFAELPVLEHRRTGTATARPLSARLREGRRLYGLGYSLPFFAARCVRRSLERPRLAGSAAALCAYLAAWLRRDALVLPPDVVAFLRAEQAGKLRRLGRTRPPAPRAGALP